MPSGVNSLRVTWGLRFLRAIARHELVDGKVIADDDGEAGPRFRDDRFGWLWVRTRLRPIGYGWSWSSARQDGQHSMDDALVRQLLAVPDGTFDGDPAAHKAERFLECPTWGQ